MRRALKESNRFRRVDIVNMSKPQFDSRKKYIIVARDPISRFISAFNWRYKLVVKDEVQKNRFPGEYEILKKYKNLSNFSEALYDEEGILVSEVAQEFETVHHLRESIAFYLEDFLKVCPSSSIIDVIMTETLSYDIERVLGVSQSNVSHEKNNKNFGNSDLTDRARKNLVQYARSDYNALKKLHQYGFINDSLIESIINRAGLGGEMGQGSGGNG